MSHLPRKLTTQKNTGPNENRRPWRTSASAAPWARPPSPRSRGSGRPRWLHPPRPRPRRRCRGCLLGFPWFSLGFPFIFSSFSLDCPFAGLFWSWFVWMEIQFRAGLDGSFSQNSRVITTLEGHFQGFRWDTRRTASYEGCTGPAK